MGDNKQNKDKNNITLVLVIMAILWIVLLIGILAHDPYYKNRDKEYKPREGAAAMEGKIHYIFVILK